MLCYVRDRIFVIRWELLVDINRIRDLKHWESVKHILKYLQRTRNYILVYSGSDLMPVEYTDSDIQSDSDSRKSTSGYVFILNGGAII